MPTLQKFIAAHRDELIAATRAKVAQRAVPRPTGEELDQGIPLFFYQLEERLRRPEVGTDKIRATATLHGANLLKMGLTVGQVVHDYGDVCQAITELASEQNTTVTTQEFRALNGALDDAIAMAVTEYNRMRERSRTTEEAERSGMLVHEMRNRLGAALLAFEMLKTGRVGISGSTGLALERNLRSLNELIDRSLAQVRLESGLQNRERIVVSEFVNEMADELMLEAHAFGIQLTIGPVADDLQVEADRPILGAAVTNLVQNAIKFSRAEGHVSLTTASTQDHVTFAIQDECGGLPVGKAEELFRPFVKNGKNKKSLGLGLTICRKGVEASGGTVSLLDLPGKGCIFTITMPRYRP